MYARYVAISWRFWRPVTLTFDVYNWKLALHLLKCFRYKPICDRRTGKTRNAAHNNLKLLKQEIILTFGLVYISLTWKINEVFPALNMTAKSTRWSEITGNDISRTYFIYCKTLYFRCILISRFWNVEISLHFNLAFSQCSAGIYQAFDRQTGFSRVFNFAILSYSRSSRKFDAREKYVFYSSAQLYADCAVLTLFCTILTTVHL